MADKAKSENKGDMGRGGGGRGRGGGMNRGAPGGGFSRGGGGQPRGGGGNFGGRGGGPGRGDSMDRGMRGGRGGGEGGGRGRGRGGQFGGGNWGGRQDMTLIRLQEIMGPTHELPPIDCSERQFSGRSRLYIGNIGPGVTEDSLKTDLGKFGEVGELFYNSEKHFAFLRMDYRENAEKAKREMDGKMVAGRPMKVRFAPHQGALKVKNLGPWVSNELLHRAFSVFGELERAIVNVDDRGRSKGEGIVEFERKPSAMDALRRCSEGAFFLTASLRPVIVELVEECDDDDGLIDKNLPKRNHEFGMEREVGPRFAHDGSFEFEYGMKWKQLYEMKKQKLEALEREMKLEEDKLIAQMEYARYEHETETLKRQLEQREQERERTKSMWEAREQEMGKMFEMEQKRRTDEEQMMMERMKVQDDGMRKRQEENSLFMQAQELNTVLDQNDRMPWGAPGGRGGGGGPPMGGRGGGGMGMGMGMGGGGFDGGNGGFDDEMMGGGPPQMGGAGRNFDGPPMGKRGRRF